MHSLRHRHVWRIEVTVSETQRRVYSWWHVQKCNRRLLNTHTLAKCKKKVRVSNHRRLTQSVCTRVTIRRQNASAAILLFSVSYAQMHTHWPREPPLLSVCVYVCRSGEQVSLWCDAYRNKSTSISHIKIKSGGKKNERKIPIFRRNTMPVNDEIDNNNNNANVWSVLIVYFSCRSAKKIFLLFKAHWAPYFRSDESVFELN